MKKEKRPTLADSRNRYTPMNRANLTISYDGKEEEFTLEHDTPITIRSKGDIIKISVNPVPNYYTAVYQELSDKLCPCCSKVALQTEKYIDLVCLEKSRKIKEENEIQEGK